MKSFPIVIIGGLLIFASVFLPGGPRAVGALENIHGIPFPPADGAVIVTEKLAHADIYLTEPVLAKKLALTITFSPLALDRLEVGIRDNAFWLSYPKYTIYQKDLPTNNYQLQTRSVTIPLTDKLRDKDGSIDLMFFATYPGSTASEDEGLADATLWQLHTLNAHTSYEWPAAAATKDFIRSLVRREKPI